MVPASAGCGGAGPWGQQEVLVVSRRTHGGATRGPLALLLATALLLVGCGELEALLADPTGGPPANAPGAASPETLADAERPDGVPADAEAVLLDRVVDGDTIRVLPGADSSIAERGSVRVRLLNIDAPELARDGAPAECLAEEATVRVEELLADSEVVWLAADDVDRDRFDRPLRGVWTAEGVFVNEVLAAEGLATSVLFNDNDRFLAEVAAAEEEAARGGRGVHGDTCP